MKKLSKAFLVSCLLVLPFALTGCMPGTDDNGDDDDDLDDDSARNAPVVLQLT